MAETAKRRWLWPISVAAVLLVLGMTTIQNRPLSDAERLLVGTWRNQTRSTASFTFARSRAFHSQKANANGTWSASDSEIRVRVRPKLRLSWDVFAKYWTFVTDRDSHVLEIAYHFDPQGNLHMEPLPDTTWERVK